MQLLCSGVGVLQGEPRVQIVRLTLPTQHKGAHGGTGGWPSLQCQSVTKGACCQLCGIKAAQGLAMQDLCEEQSCHLLCTRLCTCARLTQG